MLAAAEPPASVGAHVAQAESDLLFGREDELAMLGRAMDAARLHPAVVYVHGPAGVGKSVLLKAFCRHVESGGGQALLLDGATCRGFPATILQAIQGQLGVGRTESASTPEALAAELNTRGRQGGIVLCIDHYEELVASDAWLRQQLIYRLGPGVCTVLSDRRPPEEAWPGDRAWRSVLRVMEVREFSDEQAMRFMRHLGVLDPAACVAALRLGGHAPSLLGVAADAVMRLSGRLSLRVDPLESPQEDDGLSSALLEQIVHPGSRRRTWRAGLGAADVDQLLAASALLRAFDREVLAAMVGPPVAAAGWSPFTALHVVFPQDGRHVLHETVRNSVERIVHRRRLWAQRQWQRRALAHLLERLESYGVAGDRGFAWVEAVRLALCVCGPFSAVLGFGRNAVFETGRTATREDIAEVLSFAAGLPGPHAERLQRLLTQFPVHPEGLRLVRDSNGGLAAVGVVASAHGGGWPGDGDSGGGVPAVQKWAAQYGGRVAILGPLLASPGMPAALPLLLYRLSVEFGGWDRILAPGLVPGDVPLLGALGFREEAVPGARMPALVLDMIAAGGHVGWLRHVAKPMVEAIIPRAQMRDAARDALMALHSEDRLLDTAAARHFRAIHGPAPLAAVRGWVLDALATADLGRLPVPGRELLLRYYVDRAGSHEAIAEEMNLTRATYFRWHRQTLDRFAESLFS